MKNCGNSRNNPKFFAYMKHNDLEAEANLFIQDGGRYYVENAAMATISRMQEVFAGEAERLGLQNEDDVVAMVKEVRRDRWKKSHADNA